MQQNMFTPGLGWRTLVMINGEPDDGEDNPDTVPRDQRVPSKKFVVSNGDPAPSPARFGGAPRGTVVINADHE